MNYKDKNYKDKMELNKIYTGHVVDVLKTFPYKSINMVMTSPPYWALRHYKTSSQIWGGDENCEHDWVNHIQKPKGGKGSISANVGANKNDEANMRNDPLTTNFCCKCNAWRGELGHEPTFDLYVKHLCDIFDEIKRVLRDDGSIYVNIGDTYGTKSGSGFANDSLNPLTPEEISNRTGIFKANDLRGTTKEMHKNLCNIPARFSIEMQNRGWTLRNEIVWYKNNVMPSSVTDRYTVDFEKIYFFTKNKKYYFKQQFDPYTKPIDRWGGEEIDEHDGKYSKKEEDVPTYPKMKRSLRPNPLGKNKRATWHINTKPYKDAHFATYNVEICKTPIDASCPTEQCSVCGKPKIMTYDRVVDEQDKKRPIGHKGNIDRSDAGNIYVKKNVYERDYVAVCDCNGGFERGIVLDPFMGSGTTAIEAINQNKNYVGIELNDEYTQLAEKRIKDEFPYYGNDFLDKL